MKFEIRDLLIATALIAMSLFAFRLYQDGQQMKEEIAATEEALRHKKSELGMGLVLTSDAAARFDYYQLIDSFDQLAAETFEKLRLKYSAVEPKPAKVSFRSTPSLLDRFGQSKTQYRISIPPDYPVFLRWGTTDFTSTSGDYDQRDWLPESEVGQWRPGEIQLKPGLQDLVVAINRESKNHAAFIEIWLDDLEVLKAETMESYPKFSSFTRITPSKQHDFGLRDDRFIKGLGSVLLKSPLDDKGRLKFRYWLSGTPTPAAFASDPSKGNSSD